MYPHACTMVCMWRLGDSLQRLILSFHNVDPWGSTHVSGLTSSAFTCWAVSLTSLSYFKVCGSILLNSMLLHLIVHIVMKLTPLSISRMFSFFPAQALYPLNTVPPSPPAFSPWKPLFFVWLTFETGFLCVTLLSVLELSL